jgi:hypothetical protein
MYTITDENIDFILEDLSNRGIVTEGLRLNLLDHICILIEENLEEDGDFNRFYNKTIKSFYKKELSELEKETEYYLYYQNNLVMKKAMVISGVCSAAGFIGGSLGKILLLPITDFLLFLGFISCVLLFLPLLFIVLFKELKSRKNLVIFGSGIISLMLYFICMLMKCVGLPSSGMHTGLENLSNTWLFMWLTGLGIASFIFIPSYLIAGMRKPETKITTIITSILLVAFIGIQFRLTNLKQIRFNSGQHTVIKSSSLSEKNSQLLSYSDKTK